MMTYKEIENATLEQLNEELAAGGFPSQETNLENARKSVRRMQAQFRLTKQEAFDVGYDHGTEMAYESGSNLAGSDGWDGMLINADPVFVREKLGWEGQDSDEQAIELMAEYCRGCQAGADAACGQCLPSPHPQWDPVHFFGE